MSIIKEISGKIILDSRGDGTVEAHIVFESGAVGIASTPSGKSKGTHEAFTLPPERAVEIINGELAETFRGRRFATQRDFDSELINLDGTDNKSRIGGNTTTALSAAFAKASSISEHLPLFKYFSESLGQNIPHGKLRLFANMIEGGLHAENNLRFQEHWAIPKAVSFTSQVDIVNSFFKKLGEELQNLFPEAKIFFSDEGSYSLNFESEDIPFSIMMKLREKLGLMLKIDFGMDAAASDVKGEPLELAKIYKEWHRKFGLIAIEDPFSEEDFIDFHRLHGELPEVTIIGDDLTTTNVSLMAKANKNLSVDGIIIKPNQIGTITEALDAVALARKYGWQVVVSHRSGETMDDWIADFAVGCGADGFKLGAPSKPERLVKYNRLLQIEKEIANL